MAERTAARPLRPTRPTAAKAAAAKFTQSKVRRLSIRVSQETLRSVKKKAILSDKTVKRFVLDLLAANGVDVAESDRVDDSDDAE